MGARALAFDVFGTVVDWRSSVIAELEAFGKSHGVEQDWATFADNWRKGYLPAMDRVRRGELPWTRIDDLHRMILEELLRDAGITEVSDADVDRLNRAWHRLDPWPDTVEGLTRLKERFVITTLSNGNVSLLTNMAKRAGLPWDCVISAELFRHYKPDPEAYLGCADLLGVRPDELMLVAAHPGDLRAAQHVGLMAAYVARPLEYGPNQRAHQVTDGEFDVTATDFLDLADQLGV
ncbi:haloacid dehalogenase, type II [Mycolicibacterium moriokaense]|uniref:Haloacid dehalogenase n=1 Tax=Mycolicibacterium moriokaense TaxID=39691 RepID=A0AAD1H6L0_9MYCO|nr:haloacid dehalogenase type II [Mycolicibacterium moriokaense]MCV7037692.1 haloacid dehalogenase type II [Mycolicibacterium moriokaense]ORB23731.1 haloacid dehalogenase, type II [Mycolicibacterium moriokaense]BBW99368.1 haloacid dehalogenase [Mycolicibacterium moriokaense]